jgi:hypothetical protein
LPTYKAVVVVYNPLKGDTVLITDGAARTDVSQTGTIPNRHVGDEILMFISFKNFAETQLSNSIIIGSGTFS